MNSLDKMEDYDRLEAALAKEKAESKELRRKVAMLRDATMHSAGLTGYFEYVKAALDNTQATAEAYEREVQAKALEKFGAEVLETVNYSDADDHSFERGKEAVARDAITVAIDLRAANKGKE